MGMGVRTPGRIGGNKMKDHILKKNIYYHDTDAGGVVYYGNYWKFLEEGRTEFCVEKGFDVRALYNQGISFVVVHAEADYKAPARYGDIVTVHTRVDSVGNSSIHFSQEIFKDGVLLVAAKIIWACVGKDFKSQRVSDAVRAALAS
jgi:acyl-CoA thioester hydrolase